MAGCDDLCSPFSTEGCQEPLRDHEIELHVDSFLAVGRGAPGMRV